MASSSSTRLTTTSHAVLGLLSLGEWSAYELTQLMERSVALILPRAASVVYAEPKRLVARGLAEARTERRGRREVARYSITPAGREALREWIENPAPFPQLDAEVVVQALFAGEESRSAVRRRVSELRAEAEERLAAVARQNEGYLDGSPVQFPERLPVIALTGRFVYDHLRALADWAAWAEANLVRWPADRSWAVSVLEEIREEHSAREGSVDPAGSR